MKHAWILMVLAVLLLGSGAALAAKGGNGGGGGGGGGGKPGDGDPPATLPDDPQVVLKVNTTYDSPNEGTLYVMNADGSERAEIYAGYVNGRPCWSSDGTRILFGGDANGPGIYSIKPDGTDLTKVVATNQPPFKLCVSPVATPDGAFKIVFEDWTDPDGNGINDDIDLFLVNEDGTGLVPLTSTPTLRERHPSWSKDGDKIAFARQVDPANLQGGQDIFVIQLSGDGNGSWSVLSETCLTDGIDVSDSPLANEVSVSQPDWGRTANVLAVVAKGSDDLWDSLWLINISDPANPVDLMDGLATQNVRQPTWGPNDLQIMYNGSNDEFPTGSLWTIDVDGTNRTELVGRAGKYNRKKKTWPDNNCLPFWKR